MNKTCKSKESSNVFWRTIYNFFVNKNKYTGNTELNEIDNTLDNSLLPLPISSSGYIKTSTQFYYVDKTLLIKDLIDKNTETTVFTRPRRFGKSLNMDMLKVFFEKTNEDTSIYFKNKKIWACGKKYQQHQGKYPVIYLTFKDIKSQTWSVTYEKICLLLRDEFVRHKEVLSSSILDTIEKTDIQKIISLTATQALLENSLFILSKALYDHYGVEPVVIIDEYDTPIRYCQK